jgi:hypothetical protein
VQVASAALLKGEEKRTPSVSSEQAAAPGTPSTSNTPPPPITATPADSGATPQPRSHTRAHTQTLVHRTRISDRESGAPWHPPSSRTWPANPWGPRGRSKRSRGCNSGIKRCGGTLSKTLAAQRRHSRPETADADAHDPHTLAEAPHIHRSRHTSMPPLSQGVKWATSDHVDIHAEPVSQPAWAHPLGGS